MPHAVRRRTCTEAEILKKITALEERMAAAEDSYESDENFEEENEYDADIEIPI